MTDVNILAGEFSPLFLKWRVLQESLLPATGYTDEIWNFIHETYILISQSFREES